MKHLFRTVMMLAVLAVAACSQKSDGASIAEKNDKDTNMATQTPDTASVKIEMKTNAGDIVMLLYGDTPLHRDNMKKLVEEGYYDGLLFHRVINDFMVQAGDPDSKDAPAGKHLGSGGPGYTVPAEIVYPKHFHKRGAVAAARTGDQMNPERRSSGSQFYIVTGTTYNADQLNANAANAAMQNHFNELVQVHRAEIAQMQQSGDRQGLMALQQQLIEQTQAWADTADISLPAEILEAYTTVGGTPHLDDQYTVFGEVISGMDVVDKIQKVATDGADRPVDDVKIISMKVLDD